ncbi:HIRAN domain-containing protein [Gordonibacter sp. An230]|uniref:HIRAN domain-containing protein n=1 Tax=Gordonibacter sp. An230 TaxID=1965592 RepID=UPI0019516A2D|nr:HIRAN domain-containing protein [Gordonibacter sp. An230]
MAGFQYWDGPAAISELAPGATLVLEPEPDNPYDPSAVALRTNGMKLGYLPTEKNDMAFALLHFGHADALEARILQANPEADPWKQVRIGLYMADARKKA